HDGHHEVHQDERRRRRQSSKQLECVLSISGGNGGNTLVREDLADRFTDVFVVFHHQDGRLFGRTRPRSRLVASRAVRFTAKDLGLTSIDVGSASPYSVELLDS